MKCRILHDSAGRMRVHAEMYRMSIAQADLLETYLQKIDGVEKAAVNERTMNACIVYHGTRESIIQALSLFSCDVSPEVKTNGEKRALARNAEDRIFHHVMKRILKRLFLPVNVRALFTMANAVPYLFKGLQTLRENRMRVELLDAVTIGVSLLRSDFDTASSIMFLLGLSEILEEWTHKKSIDDLARSMALNVDQVWKVEDDGQEVLVSVSDVKKDDHLILRASNMIPMDGEVLSGEMSVNQSSMTGESKAVFKSAGSLVYAGTVVEEGECIYAVRESQGEGRYDRIVQMIEASEKLKSSSEEKAFRLSDKLVPYSFLTTVLTYALTRNAVRAVSVLMVDYSCALKLAMPITVLSAMRESTKYHIAVKGGRFLEEAAKADTIVFDKTGTLTYSKPHFAGLIPFNHEDETEMLRLAACLEEHFPHSIAGAVVRAAMERGITHEEKHAKVEYIVAHGIASSVNGKRVVIGSYHFVFEDERCVIPEDEKNKFERIDAACSHLYMAIDSVLSAVICIEDPIRPETAAVIDELHSLGIKNIVMMTGDSAKTAAMISTKAGVDEYHAEVLPEEKAAFVKKKREEGHHVLMVGDGINDSPALSEADCGIAISDGAAIAREIADVTISEDSLYQLVILRRIAMAMEKRIQMNYRVIMGFNSALILSGALGILAPTVSAYLHNGSTLLISMHSMRDLLS